MRVNTESLIGCQVEINKGPKCAGLFTQHISPRTQIGVPSPLNRILSLYMMYKKLKMRSKD